MFVILSRLSLVHLPAWFSFKNKTTTKTKSERRSKRDRQRRKKRKAVRLSPSPGAQSDPAHTSCSACGLRSPDQLGLLQQLPSWPAAELADPPRAFCSPLWQLGADGGCSVLSLHLRVLTRRKLTRQRQHTASLSVSVSLGLSVCFLGWSPPRACCPQWTWMEYFLSFRNWKSLSFVLLFRAIKARVFSSKSWSMVKMILALSSAFLSPEFLKSLWSDSWSTFSKMLPTAFLREAVSKW